MSNDLMNIMDENQEKMTPVMHLFCLSLHSESNSTYDEWRDALGKGEGTILTLPSLWNLRDYKN